MSHPEQLASSARGWPTKGAQALSALLLAALLVFATGCQQTPAQSGAEDLTSTAQVTRGDMAEVVRLAGQVIPLDSRQLTFGTVGGAVREVLVRQGQEVEKDQELVKLDTSDLERRLYESQADLKVAEAILAEAQRAASQTDIAQAEAELASAEYALSQAKYDLELATKAGLAPLEEAVANAKAAVQEAQDQLAMMEIQLNLSSIRTLEYQQAFFQRAIRDAQTDAERKDNQEALADVERKMLQARTSRANSMQEMRDRIADMKEAQAQAEAKLERVRSGQEDPTKTLRLAQEQATAQAEAARKKLEDLRAGLDTDAIKAARTAFQAAEARVKDIEDLIAATTLRAPFSGIVFATFVTPDQTVGPSDNIIYLVDAKTLRVRAQASEMDVVRLQLGQPVRITFDTYPGLMFDGEMLELPLRGAQSQGISAFPIVTSLDPGESDIRPGMVANLRVVIGEKLDVLMVPTAAIRYQGIDTYVVLPGADGTTEQRSVEIGMNDGIMAEVLSGLSEGETVLMPLVAPTEPQYYYGR
ncbi:MAG: efflux RND transporter periplasmic adaptor subunit [Chloroflexi bacterium]|nr:efflux RND transporter periplasmic adaptor subunit [Chloroflexota bacterium]